MGGCCNSNEAPSDARLLDTETYSKKRNKRETTGEYRSSTTRNGAGSDYSDTDTDASTVGKKGSRFSIRKKKKKPVPIERDESFIESSPEYPLPDNGVQPPEGGLDADLVSDISIGTDDDFDDIHDNNKDKDRNNANDNYKDDKAGAKASIFEANSNDDSEEEEDANRLLSEEEELLILGFRLYTNLDIKDRKWKLKTYKMCFKGNECVDWIIKNGLAMTRRQAIEKGQQLVRADIICHVEREHDFEDSPYFYKFINPSIAFKNVSTKYGAIIRNRENTQVDVMKFKLIQGLAIQLKSGLDIKDRKYRLKVYPSCFVGEEAVTWMIKNNIAKSRNEAQELGQMLVDNQIIRHVTQEHEFRDGKKFYEFIKQ